MGDMAYQHRHHQQQPLPAPLLHHHNSHYPYYPPPPPPPPGASVTGPPQPPLPPLPHGYHHYHQSPYGDSYSHLQLPGSYPDDVRTLFIAGLPEDIKHREIYNLFREFPGYQSCQLRCSEQSSQAFAFAVFADQQSAITAMHSLNGFIFDLERESALHIDLAKSNSRSKRPRADDGSLCSFVKKGGGSSTYSRGFADPGVGSHIPALGNSAHITNGYPSSQSDVNFDYKAIDDRDTKKNSSASYVPRNCPPCPTLFVANLGPTCSEQELTQVFSRCRGFLKLKMQNRKGTPVAFIDFQDVASSAEALNNLQGFHLYSSEGEGIRLEYAKSRMGTKVRQIAQ